MYLSRGCHPALPSFIIQQKVLAGFKDESQNQCRKCTTVVEKWGAENMLLSECYKHDLYKRESAKGIQKDAFLCLRNQEFEQDGKASDSKNTNSASGTISGASLGPILSHEQFSE